MKDLIERLRAHPDEAVRHWEDWAQEADTLMREAAAALEAEASEGERRGLERAAEVAEAMPWYRLETPGHVRSNQPKDVAAAIRALIQKDAPQ